MSHHYSFCDKHYFYHPYHYRYLEYPSDLISSLLYPEKKQSIIISKLGRTEYVLDGKYHREDGPAVIYDNGREEWYYEGNLHRVDGPAVIRSNGSEEYWINGERVVNSFQKISQNLTFSK